jgi:hypothetical protein
MLARLQAAAARLRAALDQPPGAARMDRADLATVLRAAEQAIRLRAYVVHREGCRHHQPRPYGKVRIPGPCTCGLQDALEGRFPGEPPAPEWGAGRAGGGGAG